MRFQKYLMLISLIIAALSFVYSIAFCSSTIYQYNTLYLKSTGTERVDGAYAFWQTAQDFSDLFLWLSIVLILVVILNYVMATNKRRNYYITNYISIGLTIVYQVVFAVLLIALLSNAFAYFNEIDVDAAKRYYERINGEGSFRYSTWNFTVGYVLAAVIICNAVVMGLNLLWKIKLMKGEKALLEAGLVKEVA